MEADDRQVTSFHSPTAIPPSALDKTEYHGALPSSSASMILTPGQPTPALTLWRQASGRTAIRTPYFNFFSDAERETLGHEKSFSEYLVKVNINLNFKKLHEDGM